MFVLLVIISNIVISVKIFVFVFYRGSFIKVEDVVDIFVRVVNMFKMVKKWVGEFC